LSHYPTISDVLKSPCGELNQHLVETNEKVKKKRRKYRNKPCEVDGIKFDSEKEAKRYSELKLLLKIGEIGLLERQKPFLLIEANETERKCVYVADFVYWDTKTGKQVVEDVKSDMTRKLPVYIMKRKLMKSKYNIEITEK
jgi:hypothetical protein